MHKNNRISLYLLGCLCLLVLGALVALLLRGEAQAADTEPQKETASGLWGNPDWLRFRNYALEEDPDRPGWYYCFVYDDMKDPAAYSDNFDGNYYHYFYQWYNLRYWDEPLSDDEEALARDCAKLEALLDQKKTPEEIRALSTGDLSFEVLDGERFLRLKDKAMCLDSLPREPKLQRSVDMSYDFFRLQEPWEADGYRFRMANISSDGFMEKAWIDVLYADGQLLSDLVEAGKASPEQEEAFALMQKMASIMEGREINYIDGMEICRGRVEKLAGLDFDRLYIMLAVTDAYFMEMLYAYHEEIEPVRLPIVDLTQGGELESLPWVEPEH